ncbi:ATP-NAD kinase family protein [Paucibacter sp. B2R-40]|uniref:ATP-NAD kinase family protein n=1 Tax=Paucibacter sp. B2R-40 TaxID=2893554 RepID=UPI0021E4E610|nr:ATP-NAD kinase family protein [Paucibacter sp. B2R-40]MCV2356355.1 ATP-NAD kinase family protein [Paucibacter sp. B2R-40]
MRPRVGLIINPLAGAGGKLGLHGSDGLGCAASVWSSDRAAIALASFCELGSSIDWISGPGAMGEDLLRSRGAAPQVLALKHPGPSSAADTRALARRMRELGVDLLLFAGGDGTARDVQAGVLAAALSGGDGDQALPVLGIPAGVKMQSACFGVSPAAAGRLARAFLATRARRTEPREVMDMDEAALREGRVLPQLHGYLATPTDPRLLQGRKTRSLPCDSEAATALAQSLVAELSRGVHVIGPGSTTWALKQALKLAGSLIGVDLVIDGKLWLRDATEQELHDFLLATPRRAGLWLTAIGGQGHVIGRGNAPLSARVLRAIGPAAMTVLITPAKLQALAGQCAGLLRMDSACAEVDALFSGPVRVLSGPRDRAMLNLVAE